MENLTSKTCEGTAAGPKAIVIDMGGHKICAGFSGEKQPAVVFSPQLEGMQESPIKNGEISNWEDMEKVLDKVFAELKVSSKDYPVLLTESVLNPAEKRERTTELMFKKYGVTSFFLGKRPVLAMYAHGQKTGITVHCGKDCTFIVPIIDGYADKDNAVKMQIAPGASFDAIFAGLSQQVYTVATKCPPEILATLLDNIALVGGNSMDPEFEARLQAGVQALAGGSRVKVTATSYREYCSWIGGSILAALAAMSTLWVTKQHFQEKGAKAIAAPP